MPVMKRGDIGWPCDAAWDIDVENGIARRASQYVVEQVVLRDLIKFWRDVNIVQKRLRRVAFPRSSASAAGFKAPKIETPKACSPATS